MWDIVELRNSCMPMIGSQESCRVLDLRRKVTQDQHSRLVRSDKQRPDKVLKVLDDIRQTTEAQAQQEEVNELAK